MKCKVALLVCGIFLIGGLSSCTTQYESTGVVTMNESLPQDLDTYIQTEFDKSHLPGMSMAIVSADEVLFEGCYGEAESMDQPFMLGSLSKSFTALAIMQLEEQGLVNLDAPAAKYLSEIDANAKVTVRQLLNQTSGIKTSDTWEHYSPSDSIQPFTYANQNYNLLGRIVEEVSGEAYETYVTNHIFKPLGMEHSYASKTEAEKDNLIPGNRNYFGISLHQEMPYPKSMDSGWMTVSSAYLISTGSDMGKYLQWYLSDEESEVLSVEGRHRMFTETTPEAHGQKYGLGWGIETVNGKQIYQHGGNLENYTSYCYIVPDKGFAVVALSNNCDFFVGDGYIIRIPQNVTYRMLGWDTNEIGEHDYVKQHMILDGIFVLVLLLSSIPLLHYKKWANKEHNMVVTILTIAVFHVIVPTLYLTIWRFIADRPLYVVMRFVPDLFLVLCLAAACLYIAGILKIIHITKKCGPKK